MMKVTSRVKRRYLWYCLCTCSTFLFIRQLSREFGLAVPTFFYYDSIENPADGSTGTAIIGQDYKEASRERRRACALNFYGLPRAFKPLVLPSLIQNVIIPNIRYDCDYHVHFYNITHEPPSRSGKGGIIVSEDVYLLRQAVHTAAREAGRPLPYVGFTQDTAEEFERNQSKLLHDIRRNHTDGKNPYYGESFGFPVETYVNIIKMWYSIAAAWESMEKHASMHAIKYERVAMMRSDVVYVTPTDIFRPASSLYDEAAFDRFCAPLYDEGAFDTFSNQSVIPGFAKFPVNDRMFYGPYEATKIWATGRFSRLNEWVFQLHQPLHSEQFLNATILPAIRRQGISIGVDLRICFLRARADGTVLTSDCQGGASKGLLERLLNKTCPPYRDEVGRRLVKCPIT